MRLSFTIATLAIFSFTSAFVIPLERITSAPVPTKRSLVKRHEWRHRHGDHRQTDPGEQGQQGQDEEGGRVGQHGQDKQQAQNVVTVYTTVTGSPPQATASEDDGHAECEGGTKDDEAPEAPVESGIPEENSPARQGDSPPVREQAEPSAEDNKAGSEKSDSEGKHDPPAEGSPDQGKQNPVPENSEDRGKHNAHADDQSDHRPSAQDNPSSAEGRPDSAPGDSGDSEKVDSLPIKAANAGDMGIQAQSQGRGEHEGQTAVKAEDSGDAKKQGPPAVMSDDELKSGDNAEFDNDSSSSASHSDVPDSPVPNAKKPEGKPIGGNVLTSDGQQKVLALHNAIREANGVPKLEWDDKLAKYSAGWTNKCVAHSEHSGGDKYGENMAGAGGDKPDPVGFIKMWTDEQSAFQCRKPADDEFHAVGHYTALMWKEVKYVGCSLQECATMGDGDKSMPWHWTCNYWPPPNMMSGEEDAYKKNVPCSKNKPDELS